MRDIIERRRAELTTELERGERLLAELHTRQNDVRADLLRISGALQMLDELLQVDSAREHSEPLLQRVAG
ncbi:MAG: hypothetical protein ABJB74_02970 [Gemmatimonas sp.]